MSRPSRKQPTSASVHVSAKKATYIEQLNVEHAVVAVPAPLPLPPKELASLLQPYLEYLVELCRFVPLRGIRREDRHERGDPQRMAEDPDERLELERIFVELDTTTQLAVNKSTAKRSRNPGKRGVELWGEEGREPRTRPLPALEAAASCSSRHLVLHGAPGCGKSTFIRFLVLGLAHCGLGHEEQWLPRLPAWPREEATLLPLRIELRLFAVWLKEQKIDQAEPCHLWDYFTEWLRALSGKRSWRDPLPAVEQTVRAGRAIFLLDGLDEVPGGNGKVFVRDCLEKFAREGIGQSCRIIVTCRTRSYDADYKGRNLHLFEPAPSHVAGQKPAAEAHRGRRRPADRSGKAPAAAAEIEQPLPTAFELDDFDDPKKQRFIRSWYDALVTLEEFNRADADVRVQALRAAVCDPQNPRLAELAANPLLLTVICHLHSSQQDHKLPDNRAELFHDLIDLLLCRWAERHQGRKDESLLPGATETLAELLADPGVRGFEREHLLQLVAELAHDHYRGGQNEKLVLIPEATLRKRLMAEHHDADTEKGAGWAERVMNFIQLRAGLLNSPDGGENFDFPHSLLGEYLVAYHLTRQRRSSEVVASKVTSDGTWDEVVRLVAGHHVFVNKETRDALDLLEELSAPAKGKQAAVASVTDVEWRRVALAADILHEMGPERWGRERGQGPACRNQVRDLLVLLMREGALPARDRARAGAILGHLGDPREGVGLEPGAAPAVPKFAWVEIRARKFPMGNDGPKAKFDSEKPRFECGLVKQRYWISRYPVTVEQYQAFVAAGGYEMEEPIWTQGGLHWREHLGIRGPGDDKYDSVFRTANHPQVGVSWYEAVAFCRWLNQPATRAQLALPEPSGIIQLPSEAQWERAARGTTARDYPWENGSENDLSTHCNWHGTGVGHTSGVGLFPKGCTPEGIADLVGNVWEWCATKWRENYHDYDEPNVSDDPDGDDARVLRGGSWAVGAPTGLRAANRDDALPGLRGTDYGFRVVVVGGACRKAATSENSARCRMGNAPVRPEPRSQPNLPEHAPRTRGKYAAAGRGR